MTTKTTNQNENASESQQIELLEQAIADFRAEQLAKKTKVQELLLAEDPVNGRTFHDEIFQLKQDKLRLDTEIQFLEVKIRRLKSTW